MFARKKREKQFDRCVPKACSWYQIYLRTYTYVTVASAIGSVQGVRLRRPLPRGERVGWQGRSRREGGGDGRNGTSR